MNRCRFCLSQVTTYAVCHLNYNKKLLIIKNIEILHCMFNYPQLIQKIGSMEAEFTKFWEETEERHKEDSRQIGDILKAIGNLSTAVDNLASKEASKKPESKEPPTFAFGSFIHPDEEVKSGKNASRRKEVGVVTTTRMSSSEN
ncbi:hypothetical protein L2E82_47394 [Cichorium intybus]|uniref:Uncharacterized protein n=1 Tax=Cichorium intybus TaxID=13427 RepID=A0ACB8YUM2_CICIN|nr:hypothetical protein L2E82_47394 [Cichorium intybus]